MFTLPGKRVIVSLCDGAVLSAETKLSIFSVRLRNIECTNPGKAPVTVDGWMAVPVFAIVSVQVVS